MCVFEEIRFYQHVVRKKAMEALMEALDEKESREMVVQRFKIGKTVFFDLFALL
ncbi:hypothetical protein [Wolbachia pipientis]|uniref:hypothetical protein n=1 Tax=Wolbachia pipientis TaxID=955 RepID=UPI00164ADC66|nr:hypothetical protein [Wolbachia pipientis]